MGIHVNGEKVPIGIYVNVGEKKILKISLASIYGNVVEHEYFGHQNLWVVTNAEASPSLATG